MDPSILTYGILTIIAIIIIFFVFRKVIKSLIYVAGLLVVVLLIASLFAYTDIQDLRDNWDQPKIFLLEDDGKYLAGFSATFDDFEETEFLTLTEIDNFNTLEDLDEIKGEHDRLVITNINAFNKTKDLTIKEESFPKYYLFEMLRSDNPIDLFAEEMAKRKDYEVEDAKEEFKDLTSDIDQVQFKAHIFVGLIAENIEQSNLFLIEELKAENIKVHPCTSVFKIIKSVPTSTVKKYTQKATEKVKEKLKEKVEEEI